MKNYSSVPLQLSNNFLTDNNATKNDLERALKLILLGNKLLKKKVDSLKFVIPPQLLLPTSVSHVLHLFHQ